MKDVIVKLLGFYVEYRKYLHRLKMDLWKSIDNEWFHTPMTQAEIMKLVRGDKK